MFGFGAAARVKRAKEAEGLMSQGATTLEMIGVNNSDVEFNDNDTLVDMVLLVDWKG